MKAMILAAGLGTRLKELTANKPKALVEINGKPLIAHVIEKLVSSGFTEIVVNVHHFADQLISYLKSNAFGATIHISDEKNQLLDTGGGIFNARQFLSGNEPFLVHNVDIISDINLQELYRYHMASNPLATLAVANRDSSRKFLFSKSQRLIGWKNLKTNEQIKPSNENVAKMQAFSGIHVINPLIFDLFAKSGPFSIVEVYLSLCPNYRIFGFDTSTCFTLDVGKVDSLAEATHFLQKPKG